MTRRLSVGVFRRWQAMMAMSCGVMTALLVPRS
jgi:hypothetical protein